MAYDGPALLTVGERSCTVNLRLAGHVEPVDGRYHWGGRIRPDDDLVRLVQSGQRAVTVQIGQLAAVPARLGEPDPWGGVRIQGIGQPPFDADQDPADEPQEAP
jgi:hypothetical protein